MPLSRRNAFKILDSQIADLVPQSTGILTDAPALVAVLAAEPSGHYKRVGTFVWSSKDSRHLHDESPTEVGIPNT